MTYLVPRLILCLAGALLPGSIAWGQEEAVVEQLAPVLAAEDARQWQPELFQRALVAPDSVVRRVAAMAAGRIGDLRATPLLLRLLEQPDSTVSVAAAFALGLLRDSAAVQPLIERLTGLPPLDTATADEAVSALAKIGGRRSAEFFASVLQGTVALSQTDPAPATSQMLLETWRLGPAARADALVPFADDTLQSIRWRTIYSLGRLRSGVAANQLMGALRAPDAATRATATRALTRDYAVGAKLAPTTVSGLLVRSLDDDDPGVRISALRSLATYHDSALSATVAPRVDDPDGNVRVQAASALGELSGSTATVALRRVLKGKGSFALRREALLALARTDPGSLWTASAPWRSSADWRDRAAAAEGWAAAGAKGAPWFIADADGRVIAAGLQAWASAVPGPDAALVATSRRLLVHSDAAVRSVAADAVARAADPADLSALAAMYARSSRDSFPDAALSALGGIAAIAGSTTQARERVDREFLSTLPRPSNYLVRHWAESNWPAASERWGPAYPIATGRTLQDYRDVVRRFVVAPDSVARPHVLIDIDQRGVLEVELYGPEAPLTVANFLRLVDRRFFDGNRWHRVVPNFVVQDGDPRGDGFGGPGGSIRDEINRSRYGIKPMLGMALSGPDTGASQWFINLAPQPHLDGTYTVFGRAVGNVGALARITQGDVIRTIRRK
ncbi:MAG TPA: peptidylprolyl isomerase [Gemmatimonadales bacterium]|nr:peptidylprolyl isomerase [Gemmatimonadales bacterium]